MKIASRSSALALVQAETVAAALGGAELVAVKTADAEVGDKARFVRGVERALLAGDADLAVHSAKDLPGEMPDPLSLIGVPPREDPSDAFVGEAESLDRIGDGARIGTASLRRRSQLLAVRPDLDVREARGNVDTRLRRLGEGAYDALVLAAAGLERLGRAEGEPVAADVMLPAPGQGCLALEGREGDRAVGELAVELTDFAALVALTAERALVARLEATCDTPVGAFARLDGEALALHGYAGTPDGATWIRDALEGPAKEPAALGAAVGERMLAAGAREVLDAAAAAGG